MFHQARSAFLRVFSDDYFVVWKIFRIAEVYDL